MMITNILDLCSQREADREKFIREVEWLVIENKENNFYDLDPSDQQTLVGALLAALDDQTEWLIESKDADMIMNSFAICLMEQRPKHRLYYFEVITTALIKHFGEAINEYMQDIVSTRKRVARENYYSENRPSMSLTQPF